MRKSSPEKAAEGLRAFVIVFAVFLSGRLQATENQITVAAKAGFGTGREASMESPVEELLLEVSINGYRTNIITNFHRFRDGCLAIDRDDLSLYKLKAPGDAIHYSGSFCLEKLQGLSYSYDKIGQAIAIIVSDEARETTELSARGKKPTPASSGSSQNFSAIFNYALTANFGPDDFLQKPVPRFHDIGMSLGAHFFSSYGNLDQTLSVRSSAPEIIPDILRLDTRWFYNDDDSLRTYTAGDMISGSLSWTRSIRLGGVQIKSDFDLRPDLVTQPIPSFSGSAAIPSTVEVYANQNRIFSQQVTGGPFNLSNLPMVSGPSTLKLVIRDETGKETVTEYAFFASSRLVAPGLFNYSIESGFARTFYAIDSDSYDGNPLASGSFRLGVTDRLTLEGHAEGGAGLTNLGTGIVFGLWSYGIASLSGSASDNEGHTGAQLTASLETAIWKARLYVQSLRSLADYCDLASVTAPKQHIDDLSARIASVSGAVYKRRDQVSLSLPLEAEWGSLSLNFTNAQDALNNSYEIASMSYSRPFLWDSNFSITGFNDFDNKNAWGVYAGLTFSWGKNSAGSNIQTNANGASAGGFLSRALDQEGGSYGYNIRAQEGSATFNSASVSYRSDIMKIEAQAQQTGKTAAAAISAEGSVAVMNGVYLANRIDNSFVIVETGIPGLTVLNENHPIGQTDSQGSILISNIRALEHNVISIDPSTLPVEADMEVTSQSIVPKRRGGTALRFEGIAEPPSAIVTFKDGKGDVIPAGAEVWINGASESALIGNDGEVYLTSLLAFNSAIVKIPDERSCKATFDFVRRAATQSRIENVICAFTADAATTNGITIKSKS